MFEVPLLSVGNDFTISLYKNITHDECTIENNRAGTLIHNVITLLLKTNIRYKSYITEFHGS